MVLTGEANRGMTVKDVNSETGELSDDELNAVTGGSVVDTVIDAAKTVWNIMTSPPTGGGAHVRKAGESPLE
jgi:bacteriocin-like protein